MLIKKNILLVLVLIINSFCWSQITIIPKPNDIKYTDGIFDYTKGFDVKVIRGSENTKQAYLQLLDFLKKNEINTVQYSTTTLTINLLKDGLATIPANAYNLTITPTNIALTASTDTGIYYGIQSVKQLFYNNSIKTIPCAEIKDMPMLNYRGFHLDVAHRYFPLEVIKEYIDAMALLKLNQFHWQLADENAFHIQLKSVGHITDTSDNYTQEDIKAILKYASDRFINVIPEINLASLSLVEDTTMSTRIKILDEICSLFPSKYIHLGKSLLYANDATAYLKSKGKHAIVQDLNYVKNAVVQSYKNASLGTKVASEGKQVILSPRNFCSLDFYQDWVDEKKAGYMTYLPLYRAYTFAPLKKVSDAAKTNILGAEACTPTMYIKDADELDYLVFPRLVALAECMWTKHTNKKKLTDFEQRLKSKKDYFYTERPEPEIDLVHINPAKSKKKKK